MNEGWKTLDTQGHPISSQAPGLAWIHDDPAHDGLGCDRTPELRFAIDATCPACGWPEIGFSADREVFSCSRCRHEQETRPAS